MIDGMKGKMNRLLLLLLPAAILVASPWAASAGADDLDGAMRVAIHSLPPPEDAFEVGSRSAHPSPRNAFIMSLAVPGLGQLYNAGWNVLSYDGLRAAGYATFEVVGFVQHADYQDRGDAQQVTYRAFADTAWDWKEECASFNGGDGALLEDPRPGFTGEPDWLEFYEDIHKLDKWVCGWHDFESYSEYEPNTGTPNRREYTEMRRKQNDLLGTSRNWIVAIGVNHFVSAFDAFFTARNRAGGGDDEGLTIDFGRPGTGTGGTLSLAWKF